jgi:deoxyribonuclease-4
MSIAGGVDRAVERAVAVGCTALQIFTKSSNQWAARPLPEDEVRRFRDAVRDARIEAVVAHDAYLINLCSPDDALWRRSVEACAEELERCARLGVPWLVVHPGAHMGQGEAFGVRRMAEAIDLIHDRVPADQAGLAIETTAGQGTILGHTFEQIAAIVALARDSGRIGVCLDTCHVFAAGYDLRTRSGYDETLRRFDGELGLERLRAVHVNDSKKDLGCRVDRHEHIGKGFLGTNAFGFLMNDARLVDRPFLLETPKGEDCREDVLNLDALMRLVTPGRAAAPPRPGASRRRARA